MTDAYQKLLIFSLDTKYYAISILKIKEIIGMMNITSLPNTPDFVNGIINLRGKIIPIMDLRIKFGMETGKYDEGTCIIIAEVLINGVQKLIGVIVDRVSEVVTISNEQIEPLPDFGANSDHSSILGIGKIKDKVVIILDLYEVFICEEISKILENVKESQNNNGEAACLIKSQN